MKTYPMLMRPTVGCLPAVHNVLSYACYAGGLPHHLVYDACLVFIHVTKLKELPSKNPKMLPALAVHAHVLHARGIKLARLAGADP